MKRFLIVLTVVMMLFSSCVSTGKYDLEPLGDFVMERIEADREEWYMLAASNASTHAMLQSILPIPVHDKSDDTWRIGMYYRPYFTAGNLTEEEMAAWSFDTWIVGADGTELILGGKRFGGMRDLHGSELETLLEIVGNPEGSYWFESRRNEKKGFISDVLGRLSESRSDEYATDSWHANYVRLAVRWYLCQLDNGAEETPERSVSEILENMIMARKIFNIQYDVKWGGKGVFYTPDYILLAYRPDRNLEVSK